MYKTGKNTTLKQMVYKQILNDIMDGRYTTESVLSEQQMMDNYGCSKSTVREALIELCKDNILESLPRMGYRIKPISLRDISSIVDLRLEIEALALRKAYNYLTDEFLKELRKKVVESSKNMPQSSSHNELSAYWHLNMEFHITLCEKCNNTYIMKVITELINHCSRFVPQYYRTSWRHFREMEGGKFHIAVIDALLEKDLEKAVALLQSDILQIKEELMNCVFDD